MLKLYIQRLYWKSNTKFRLPTGSIQDIRSRAYTVMFYKGEKCVVDKVALVEVGNKDTSPQKMSVTLRAQVSSYGRSTHQPGHALLCLLNVKSVKPSLPISWVMPFFTN